MWFRRDLRVDDNAALFHALEQSQKVFCVFIFDKPILDKLPTHDRRVEFIHASLIELDQKLRQLGGALIVRHAVASDEIPKLAAELNVDAVFVNHDYEPDAIQRDQKVTQHLLSQNKAFLHFKDQVIFEKDEVLTQFGQPYSVFTPYKNAWLKKLSLAPEDYLRAFSIEERQKHLAQSTPTIQGAMPSLEDLGFQPTGLLLQAGTSGAESLLDRFKSRIKRYADTRNFPSIKGTSYLSIHLRFGTLSVRSLARLGFHESIVGASNGASLWLSELIWRDFYFMILYHHPHVVERAFKPDYDRIAWEQGPTAEAYFAAWCEARTGYPLVDAAMMQLNQSGYMHNRLRMVTACFLIKDLGIDWRWGERYFAEKLNDFDLSANNGGWQWAASSGCDAQPYFRIFNPVMQSEKFDAEGKFIRQYLPQLAKLSNRDIHAPWTASPIALQGAGVTIGKNYPEPIVQHDVARQRTLERYAVVKKST